MHATGGFWVDEVNGPVGTRDATRWFCTGLLAAKSKTERRGLEDPDDEPDIPFGSRHAVAPSTIASLASPSYRLPPVRAGGLAG